MKINLKIKLIMLACLMLTQGCAFVSYTKTLPDKSVVSFKAKSLFSNSTLKGLAVESTTKTTTNGLKMATGNTEPNPESITASSEGLGSLIGTAAKAMAK